MRHEPMTATFLADLSELPAPAGPLRALTTLTRSQRRAQRRLTSSNMPL